MNHAQCCSLVATVFLLAVGCKNSVEEEGSIAGEHGETIAITLVEGDSISTAGTTITVIIAPGRPNAGTYTSDDEKLMSYAKAALEALGKPSHTVWIRVRKDKQITAIGWSRKL